MAGTGNHRAVEGVMSDVECILTYGLGVPGLGVKGTPEASARGQLFGDDGMGTREQKRRDMEEQVWWRFRVQGSGFRVLGRSGGILRSRCVSEEETCSSK